jgi:preprotein translocase subunit YajC
MPPGVILIVVLLGVMWFMLVRPQRRKQLEQRRQWETAGPGDEIVTAGGLYGTITSAVDDNDVMLEIAPGVEARVARRAIAGIFPAETEDEDEDEAIEDGSARDGSIGDASTEDAAAPDHGLAPEPAEDRRG